MRHPYSLDEMKILETPQRFAPCGGSNVFPGVLEVEFPLAVLELWVGESVEVRVAQPSEQSPGVVPSGQEVSVATTFLPSQTLATSNQLGAETSDAVGPGWDHSESL